MAPARIYPWRRMRRSRVPSNGPGRSFVAQFSAGCTTNTSGFDFRQAQLLSRRTILIFPSTPERPGKTVWIHLPTLPTASETSPALLPHLLPLKKLLVKRGVVLRRHIGDARTRDPIQFHGLADTLLLRASLGMLVIKPGLCRLEPAPTRQFSCEVDLTPFRVARRLPEFGDLGKECFDEPLNPPVAIGVGLLLPIVCDEDRTDRNRINGLTCGNDVGVVVMRERGGIIVN